MGQGNTFFRREGNFVRFSQYGLKLDISNDVNDIEYYQWLDEMIGRLGEIVPGGAIVEKDDARTEPRYNAGVYYDTADYRLLHGRMVLRTTCNPKTHAFCAFKYGQDENHVMRDHRYIFEGAEKLAIQQSPTSEESVAIVKGLLRREDIMHPGIVLGQATGITANELTPAALLIQSRKTFYVLLDGDDALRCSLDRVTVTDLRVPPEERVEKHFTEAEVPVYPRIKEHVAHDPRVEWLISTLSGSLIDRFGANVIQESKYQRAAAVLGMGT
jgi:hypothetical protein